MTTTELTSAERAVLDEIRRRPFSTQRELAARLDIARPTVAGYVERLHAKGHLLGRAYVLAEDVDVCSIGGMTMDRTLRLKRTAITATSNPATGFDSPGGVARNVAANLARLSVRCRLFSAVGDDGAGEAAIAATKAAGVDTTNVAIVDGRATGSYSAILRPDGELHLGVADLDICDTLDSHWVDRHWSRIASGRLLFADANLPAGTLAGILDRCRATGVRLAVDAVSVPKAAALPDDLNGIEFLFCNLDEARAILGDANANGRSAARKLLARGAVHAIVSAGARGTWLAGPGGVTRFSAGPGPVVDVSGAGDALIAGTLHGVLQGHGTAESTQRGMHAAWLTTRSPGAQAAELSAAALARLPDPRPDA